MKYVLICLAMLFAVGCGANRVVIKKDTCTDFGQNFAECETLE